MTRQFSISQARNQLPSLVHAVEDGTTVELTRRGRPVAVMVSIAAYEQLKEQRPDFWEAVRTFRAETDLQALDMESVLEGVRERTPGRETDL